jgi:general secretion pathway protein F
MLLRAAVTCEQQSEMAIAGLLSLLEPIMIVVMGVTVGYIVLAILLPIFDATSGF